MDILEKILGPDAGTTMRFVFAFAVVFVLVLAAAWLLKRLSRGFSSTEKRGRAPRLGILEAIAVDQRRRLVLVRRDNVEHLILIGGPSDLVVEPGIQRMPRQAMPRPSDAAGEPSVRAPAPASAQASVAPPIARPEPVARPEPRLDPSPVPQPRPEPRAVQRPVPRMTAPVAGASEDDDGAQKQLAEMAERLEMALRSPAAIQPAPAAPAGTAPRPAPTVAPAAPTPELRTRAEDRVAPAQPPVADNDTVELDAAAGQEERKSGSLFGRLARRSTE